MPEILRTLPWNFPLKVDGLPKMTDTIPSDCGDPRMETWKYLVLCCACSIGCFGMKNHQQKLTWHCTCIGNTSPFLREGFIFQPQCFRCDRVSFKEGHFWVKSESGLNDSISLPTWWIFLWPKGRDTHPTRLVRQGQSMGMISFVLVEIPGQMTWAMKKGTLVL